MGNERAAWYADTLAAARESLSILQNWATTDLERFVSAYGAA